jgi:hypothetical protein
MYFEIRHVKFTTVTMEHAPKSKAYLEWLTVKLG